MSDFGAGIFDQEPPTPPRRPRQANEARPTEAKRPAAERLEVREPAAPPPRERKEPEPEVRRQPSGRSDREAHWDSPHREPRRDVPRRSAHEPRPERDEAGDEARDEQGYEPRQRRTEREWERERGVDRANEGFDRPGDRPVERHRTQPGERHRDPPGWREPRGDVRGEPRAARDERDPWQERSARRDEFRGEPRDVEPLDDAPRDIEPRHIQPRHGERRHDARRPIERHDERHGEPRHGERRHEQRRHEEARQDDPPRTREPTGRDRGRGDAPDRTVDSPREHTGGHRHRERDDARRDERDDRPGPRSGHRPNARGDRGHGSRPEHRADARAERPDVRGSELAPSSRREASPPPVAERLAIFVDLEALLADARTRGGELSFRKLLRGIAGEATVVSAACYVTAETPALARQALAAGGFELRVHDDHDAAVSALFADAEAMSLPIDTLVVTPMLPALLPRVDTLVHAGRRVEAAGFDATAASGIPTRRLGRGCLFVP